MTENKTSGIPMTEDELKEWQQVFIDIQDEIEDVMQNGEDL